ncbi:MAG: DUF58 domain-containing protein [Acidobacteria bacterium]|nr:DUF58 domain-containing protein [Acidobacteriota bacterium]
MQALPLEVREELRYIEIFTRRKMRNLLLGDFTSRERGSGFDFDQHRKYQPGDDSRRIDWNVTARLLYPFLKLTHEERDVSTVVVADLSRSMEFTSERWTKREVVLYLAATLFFSAIQDNMGVGFLGFTDRVELYVPPMKRRRSAWHVFEEIWHCRLQSTHTDLRPALQFLNRRLRKLSVIFLISDFHFSHDAFQMAEFKRLTKRHDLVPVVVLDPLERSLAFPSGLARMRDLERGEERLVRFSKPGGLDYAAQMEEWQRSLQKLFYLSGLDHVFVDPSRSIPEPLLRMFEQRRKRR